MMFLQSWDTQGAVFQDLDGRAHALTVGDLIEIATEARDPHSGQRLPGFAVPQATIIGVEDRAEGWRLELAGDAELTITSEAVADACSPALWRVPRAPWRAADAAGLPRHAYAAVIDADEPLRACLLQVARFGFALLHGAPTAPGAVEQLIGRFGAIRETNYGRSFDVVARADANNLADTALPLPPHTDNPYRATPPDLQVLHCLQAADVGGESLLVDGLKVIAHLRREDPEAFALLVSVPVQFAWADAATRLSASDPAIELGADGALVRLRCNERSRGAILDPDPERRQAWRGANAGLAALLSDSAFAYAFRLAPGDMMIMDNRRVLHGRAGFATADTSRRLQGAYADADGLFSTLFRLTEQQATHELAALAALFGSDAMAEPYGEEVSIRDHMLQGAELAVARRLGGAVVTAALLHDVGWAMGADAGAAHEDVAADLVEPLFGAAVAEPVRQHVAAKRYLVGTRPEYHAYLSEASRQTLALQGGPMTTAECAEFAATSACAAALKLRAIDDAGKDIGGAATQFNDYAPLLRRQLIRHMLGQ